MRSSVYRLCGGDFPPPRRREKKKKQLELFRPEQSFVLYMVLDEVEISRQFLDHTVGTKVKGSKFLLCALRDTQVAVQNVLTWRVLNFRLWATLRFLHDRFFKIRQRVLVHDLKLVDYSFKKAPGSFNLE